MAYTCNYILCHIKSVFLYTAIIFLMLMLITNRMKGSIIRTHMEIINFKKWNYYSDYFYSNTEHLYIYFSKFYSNYCKGNDYIFASHIFYLG